jgi:hypothetical protein
MAILAGSAVAVVAIAGVATWANWGGSVPEPPDPGTQPPDEVAAYMASEDFAALPLKRRLAYFRQVRQAKSNAPKAFAQADLSGQQREKLRKNVGHLMWQDVVTKYCELPAGDRKAYLDRLIDKKLAGQQSAEARSKSSADQSSKGARSKGKGKAQSLAGLKKHLESMPPERRAQWAEFKRAWRDRMEQRGIERLGGAHK